MTDYKQEIARILGRMNERIVKGEGVDYDYYGDKQHGSLDIGFTLDEATQALTQLIEAEKKKARMDELDNQLPGLLNYSLNQEQLNLIHDRIKELQRGIDNE